MKIFFSAISIIFLVTAFYLKVVADSSSINDHIQVKISEQKIIDLQTRLDVTEKNMKELETLHRSEVDKMLSEKKEDIDDKMKLYISFFLVLVAVMGGLLRFFGKEELKKIIEKLAMPIIENELKIKMSKEVIDEKITAFGKPVIQEMIEDLKQKKTEYDKLYKELQDKSKDAGVQKNTSETKEKLQKFTRILSNIKEEKDYTDLDWFFKADAELEKKNYEKAVEFYTKAIKLNPKDANIYNNRGWSYFLMKDYDKAILDFKTALTLDSTLSMSYNNLGNSYSRKENFGEAIEAYENAIKFEPNDDLAYQNLAELFVMANKYEKALITIRKALPLPLDIRNKAISKWLEYVAIKLLHQDSAFVEQELDEIIRKKFTTTWMFDHFEEWLSKASIETTIKESIKEKTDLLKAKQRK